VLAEQLLAVDALAEAEEHYRAALRMDPADERIQLGLARAFHGQGKRSAALVVIEDVIFTGRAPAEAHVLHTGRRSPGPVRSTRRHAGAAADAPGTDPGRCPPGLERWAGRVPMVVGVSR